MRRTKIVATLGPATSSEEAIEAILRAGVDVVRFNFSHGDQEMHRHNAEVVRGVSARLGRNVAIMQDIQGPKIRTGEVEGDTELVEGHRVVIAPGDFVGDASRLPTSYERIAEDVEPGHRVLIDDGLIGLEVEEIKNGEVVCKVIEGGPVSSHKGLNFPDSSLSIHGLTEKDVEDLRFGVEVLKPDWIAASFVRTGQEVRDIKHLIKEFGDDVPVISKIEKHEAIDDIEEIIEASDGVMVARGDLAVELSAERVPIEQKRIVARCRRLGRPVIVATQMLDSMIRNPRPTRAEVSDVANAIFDRTDAVMLSGETAVGRYPVQSVEEMDRVCRAAEAAINYGRDIAASASWGRGDRYDAVTHAACELAEVLDAEAILTATQSGLSCIRAARFRPPNRILAVSPEERTVRRLALVWGVTAIQGEQAGSLAERFREAIEAAESTGCVKEGDEIIVIGGTAGPVPGSTNTLQVHTVGEDR
ncbi:MAG: pyruvate kinase [Rubrobacteraceae bacterium]|uniref:pyruvate kinase n=1 Tax=Rubrobacter naiadicus TaxID=1392641 RepID=UPI002362CCA7|nr:pyruvate kinase [Rubrobacter naiadicus]MBX6762820.1 pyruvate kinase [Rubrobacteraceae bacterium]MCL6437336.1 pyruvate kinase [Rubrobacteraceae bacterium]